ncbi:MULTISPECIES: hypothetical protein [unclassified Methylophaga]|jgi:hypothetical protein|uniref:hypothetical protein n=2 Tax=Methylophaga TaxID=40222 RepID=UPI000C8AA2BA|nr:MULTISPECIES: hypothetical protein [unclassified Methylophaga]MAP25583.1 hypothetical protein [Methylophaga sp.]HCO01017.1 hypothetical protein [Methylophaga sp.]|tara:strand:+ start:1071 stop:1559 length:489 start_codon:yes stop_codon:yes gene_type:complete
MLETTEILKLLLTLCNEQKSGTLFLTTADNKACHIIFEQGQIEAMAFGSVKGIEVARLLPRLLIERTSFNSTLKMPLSGRASIEDQADIFAALGLRRQARSENVDSSSHSKTPRMYRGHLVVEKGQTDSTSDRVKSPSQPVDKQPSAKPKSKRIYRGQIIED